MGCSAAPVGVNDDRRPPLACLLRAQVFGGVRRSVTNLCRATGGRGGGRQLRIRGDVSIKRNRSPFTKCYAKTLFLFLKIQNVRKVRRTLV